MNTGGAPSFGFGIDPAEPQFNPLKLVEGRWPTAPDEVVIDAATADEQGYKIGDTVKIATLKPVAGVQARRASLSTASVSRSGRATFAVFTIPTAQRLLDAGRSVRRHLGRREGRRHAGSSSSSEIQPILPATRRQCEPATSRRPRTQRDRRVHEVHPVLPARVRRHRAVRRRFRHLQHAVDHGRPADARVRHAENDRRVAPPDAAVGHPRSVRHRLRRLAHRPLRSGSAWPMG